MQENKTQKAGSYFIKNLNVSPVHLNTVVMCQSIPMELRVILLSCNSLPMFKIKSSVCIYMTRLLNGIEI